MLACYDQRPVVTPGIIGPQGLVLTLLQACNRMHGDYADPCTQPMALDSDEIVSSLAKTTTILSASPGSVADTVQHGMCKAARWYNDRADVLGGQSLHALNSYHLLHRNPLRSYLLDCSIARLVSVQCDASFRRRSIAYRGLHKPFWMALDHKHNRSGLRRLLRALSCAAVQEDLGIHLL